MKMISQKRTHHKVLQNPIVTANSNKEITNKCHKYYVQLPQGDQKSNSKDK